MKKALLSLFAAGIAAGSFAQTIANSDMETWRTGSSGTSPVVNIYAPISWYGFDSTIIANGQLFAADDYRAQLFHETDTVHGGTSSAKLMTLVQGGFGDIGGVLSNAKIDLDITAIIGGADPLSALVYTGGTATTLRTQTVSAWVKYFPGIDPGTGMWGGADVGTLTVQAIHNVGGYDSVIGTGTIDITPTATWQQVTANIVYADTFYTTSLVRIVFASSSITGTALDSSTLYVDDVSMEGVPQTGGPILPSAVNNVVSTGQMVQVYPNPATTTLYLNSPQNGGLTASLVSASGQLIATQPLSGKDAIDTRNLAAGLYIYTITDKAGKTVQHGKVTIMK